MIVRITRALLIFQFLLAAGIGAAMDKLFHLGLMPAVMIGIGIVLLLRMMITANNFWLAWYYGSVTPPEYRIGFWRAIRLFFGEYRSTMLSSSWTMPFCTFSRHLATGSTTLPVLLVHGYGCNSGYWQAMSKALAYARIMHCAVNLEPVTASIDDYVPMVHEAIECLCRECGTQQIIIVGHSMGGLAIRAYLRDHGSLRIAKAITLGTPHRGTALAQFGIGHNTRQMLWSIGEQEGLSSPWLRALASQESPAVYRLFVSIYSHHDNIIAPQTSSHLLGAKNIAHSGIGHVALALHPEIQEEVVQEIQEASQNVTRFVRAGR